MKRRHRNGRTGENDWFEDCKRRDGSCASHVDLDPLERRRGLLGWEFERRRPPRKLGGRPEPASNVEIVDLDDHAVGLEIERPAAVRPVAAEHHHLVDPVARLPVRLHGKAPVAHRREHRAVARFERASRLVGDDLVREGRQPPLRYQRRIEVAHGAGADLGVGIGTGRVEVAQRHGAHAVRRAVPVQRALDHQLGFPVRVDGMLRMVLPFAVTSSPREPLPRVAPRTSRACS